MADEDAIVTAQAPLATIGPIAVAASREQIAEWCGTLDLPPTDGTLPFTYPVRWLAHDAVRAALSSLLAGGIPIHQAQSFHYRRPLAAGEPLTLRVAISDGGGTRRQLHLHGSVFAEDGACILEMRSEVAVIGPAEATAP